MSEFDRLVEIMAKLRAPEGCPWDAQQTHRSLRQYMLEEAYEVLEAIDEGDLKRLRGELGDLLLQIVFHAQLAKEGGLFDMEEVCRKRGISLGKLPLDEQNALWEEAKRKLK